jgi:hypothetical protein
MMNEAKKAAQITAAAPVKAEEVVRKVKLVRRKVEPKVDDEPKSAMDIKSERISNTLSKISKRTFALADHIEYDNWTMDQVRNSEEIKEIEGFAELLVEYGGMSNTPGSVAVFVKKELEGLETLYKEHHKTAPKVEEPTQSTTLFPMVSRSQYRKNIELLRLAYKNLTTLKEKKPKVVDRPLYNEIKESFFNSGTIKDKNLANAFMNGLVYIYNKKYGKKELEWLDWFDARKTDQANGNNYTQTDNYRANALGKYFNIYSNDKGDDNKNVWRSNNAGYFFGFAEESKKEEPKKEEPAGIVKKQVKKIEKKIEPQVEEDDDETFDNFIESLKETEYHDYEDGVGIEVLYPTSVIVKTMKYVYDGYSFDQIIGLMRIYNYPAKELAQIINDFYEQHYIMREDGKRERKDLFADKKYIKALQSREDDARGEAGEAEETPQEGAKKKVQHLVFEHDSKLTGALGRKSYIVYEYDDGTLTKIAHSFDRWPLKKGGVIRRDWTNEGHDRVYTGTPTERDFRHPFKGKVALSPIEDLPNIYRPGLMEEADAGLRDRFYKFLNEGESVEQKQRIKREDVHKLYGFDDNGNMVFDEPTTEVKPTDPVIVYNRTTDKFSIKNIQGNGRNIYNLTTKEFSAIKRKYKKNEIPEDELNADENLQKVNYKDTEKYKQIADNLTNRVEKQRKFMDTIRQSVGHI